MSKPISILDSDYRQWVAALSKRYRQSQVKAAVKVNTEMLRFYWELGRDIIEKDAENRYGSHFYATLSRDLMAEFPGQKGFSERNLRYARKFFSLYSPTVGNLQQAAAKSIPPTLQQPAAKSADGVAEGRKAPQIVELIMADLMAVPWGHHMLISDKCSADTAKALFYVHETVKEGWSRSVLLNMISTDLYERSGKAQTNFAHTLPDETSDLAQELTRDPYDFAFTGLTKPYNEKRLKDALLGNITQFLVELGTGFAYVGKEYRLMIGEKENFIDLLFYNLRLSCYVVVEVKIGAFTFADAGQLGGYVVACNHQLRKPGRDNPTIGLLVCKEKDRVQAQYALESSSQPIGISEYELERFYPERVEGTIPTIEEIETKLGEATNNS